MRRSGGVTTAAIVLFFGSGLLILLMGLTSLVLFLPQPSDVNRSVPIASVIVGLLFYGAFSAWGIATGVGILRLRPWARISILVTSGFAVVGILFASLGMFLIVPMMKQTPPMDPSFEKVLLITWAVMLAIPFGIAIWWFVLFMLKSVRLQFETRGMAPSAVITAARFSLTTSADEATPVAYAGAIHPGAGMAASAPRKIPASIIVIAIFLLLGAPGVAYSMVFAIRLHLPFILFGVLITGWISIATIAAMGIVELVLGIALLRRKAWSLAPTIAFAVFGMVNGLVFFISASREDYISIILRNYPVPAGLSPDFMPHFMRLMLPFSMAFVIVLNLLGLYFLLTRRAAYRAACAVADEGGAA